MNILLILALGVFAFMLLALAHRARRRTNRLDQWMQLLDIGIGLYALCVIIRVLASGLSHFQPEPGEPYVMMLTAAYFAAKFAPTPGRSH